MTTTGMTFLFTDIEGSTRLWEAHPEAMRVALAQHDALLRQCIERQGGRVFKTIGDAFCAAFQEPRAAVEAVLAAQIGLRDIALPTGPLKVRMALHTGVAEARDDDFFGQPLNRVARLLATVHGGQTVVSRATQELVREDLPNGVSLRGLGEHRLKDLGQPESVFQLLHADLPADFPPLRSLGNPQLKHNLPQQVTSFVGREAQIAEVKALLGKTRLLTLTGSGGSGKTRLALQVAADLLDGSGDGVWLVELAPLTDPGLVVATVADVLGLQEEPGTPILRTLTERLRSRHLLLILDNCEHLLDACAALADTLLRTCSHTTILATSREGLGIAGETTYRVPSLSLPDPRRDANPEGLGQFEAVRLFVERAAQFQTTFAVTQENAPALASICHRLDGIPLALELAAARVRSLSVEEINGKLGQRFRLLTGGSRTALPRQQTLRSLIDWSYDLLHEAEKALLRRLSVFVGGWTLESAEAVCAGDPVEDWEVLDLLTSLGDKSLLVAETSGKATRYRFLETVRQYARDRLLEEGDGARWRDRHLAHFRSLGEAAEPQLVGPEQQVWLERLETEHDNVRAALSWATESEGEAREEGLRLAGSIGRFWYVRGYSGEGRAWFSSLLSGGGGEVAVRAKALRGAGAMASCQAYTASARALYEESLALYRELGDREGIVRLMNDLGGVAKDSGDYASARALYEESLTLFRELGNRLGIALVLSNLGACACDAGDYASARVLLEEGLTLLREVGDHKGTIYALTNLGRIALHTVDYASAQVLLEESLALARELGDREGVANDLYSLGTCAQDTGDYASAQALFEESLALARELDTREGVAIILGGLGNVARDRGDLETARSLYAQSLPLAHESVAPMDMAMILEGFALLVAREDDSRGAARIWGAAERLREENGVPLPPARRTLQDGNVAAARASLADDAAFDAAWAEGRAMALEQAVALAQGLSKDA